MTEGRVVTGKTWFNTRFTSSSWGIIFEISFRTIINTLVSVIFVFWIFTINTLDMTIS